MPIPLKTTGRIAAILGVPLHRVHYVLRTRQHIQHSATAGALRLFNNRSVAQIRHELNAIEARRLARLEAAQWQVAKEWRPRFDRKSDQQCMKLPN